VGGARVVYAGRMIASRIDPLEGLAPRKLKLAEYEQLAAQGAFDGERVELVFGEILPMSPQGTAHGWLVNHLHNRLASALGGRASVRAHSPIRVSGDSLPEPDVAVFPLAEDRPDRYPDHVRLVIEVADSSRRKDLGPKARLYALSGIPAYWTIDLVRRVVRVHSDPTDDEYRVVMTLLPDRGQHLVVPDFPDVTLSVDDLFAQI
jgi:Uma2 family endonuclease